MSKTIRIAGPRGLRIPAAVLGRGEDLLVPPHEPVKVPEAYGRQLVEDRFAYEAAAKAVEPIEPPPSPPQQ